MTMYNSISIAIYGQILNIDIPRPYPVPQSYSFPQSPSVDDLLSGMAWKDTLSSSLGGTGPYIPKILLGKYDSEEERESRRQFYKEKKLEEQIKNGLTAIKMMRKEGLISDTIAVELESKVHDDDGSCPFSCKIIG